MKQNNLSIKIIKMIAILTVCTMISYIFFYVHIKIENIMIVYLTGVLLVIIENRNFYWGVVSSISSILLFNYFFTSPRFSLEIDDPSYVITIAVFFIVSFFVSSLTSKLQNTIQITRKKEEQTKILYENSKAFLKIAGLDEILDYGIHSIHEILKLECIVYLSNDEHPDKTLKAPYYNSNMKYINQIENSSSAIWCYLNMIECGKGTNFFADSSWKYIPFRSPQQILGVVAIYLNKTIEEEDELVLETLLSQISLAVEKEKLSMIQEMNLVEIEKEKLRNTLLRSISHDLRTPLTGISGSSSFILESFDSLSKTEIMDLINDIGNDATWLNNMVENLLNMTRIQDDKLNLRKHKEVVDDLLEEVINRTPKRNRENIKINLPNQVMQVNVDGKLFIQVLVNIIDNAFKHTNEGSHVSIDVYPNDDTAVFEINDDGGGINEDKLEKIFDSFETESKGVSSDSYRGIGLGLNIAREIVHSHKGTITAFNNDMGGATFRIILPNEGE